MVFGSASDCRRAARLVVSPIAAFSCVTPSRTRSPTTTTPEAMPMRACRVDARSRLQLRDSIEDREAGAHRSLRVIFVRRGIAEIGEHAVAEVLRDHAAEPLDLGRAAGLESADHLALLLGIEPRRERARAHHVAEHDGELATLGRMKSQMCFDWDTGCGAPARMAPHSEQNFAHGRIGMNARGALDRKHGPTLAAELAADRHIRFAGPTPHPATPETDARQQ